MNKIKALSYIALAILLIVVSVIGCQPAPEKPNDPYNGNGMNNNRYNNDMDYNNIEDDDGIIDGDDNIGNNDIGNDMYNMNNNGVAQRADRIAGTIAKMNGVRGASVVISDNTAIVGLDTTNNNGNGNRIADDLRNRVESAVRTADNRINEVRITTDEAMYDRINNVMMSMRRGRPIAEFTDEIRDIMNGITTNL